MLARIALYGSALAAILLIVMYVTQPIHGYLGPIRIAQQAGSGPVHISPKPSPTHEPFVAPTPFVHPLGSKTIAQLQPLLQKHDPEAQCEMAKRLLDGSGITKDPQNGRLLLEVAARQKNPCALTNLGNLAYDAGDFATAAEYFHKAADLGYAVGFHNLGAVARYGPAHNDDEAYQWYREAAQRGYVSDYVITGSGYITGRYGHPDKWLALQWYKLGASAGDRDAIVDLAWYYIYQSDEANRYQLAMPLLKRADCPCADYEIGRLYLKGLGVRQDTDEAARYFKRAADKGDAPSETAYANLLRSGELGARDYAAALRYYRGAADQGNGEAMDAIAQMTDEGIGTARDHAAAQQMYVAAAAHCSGDALFRLAKEAAAGSPGHPRDFDKAVALGTLSGMCGEDESKTDTIVRPIMMSGKLNNERSNQLMQQYMATIHDNTGNPNFAPANAVPPGLTGKKTSS